MSAKTIVSARDTSIDVIKTIAIFGVITIHIATGGYGHNVASFNWTSSVLWGCLVRASVPLFLMCSGAAMLDGGKDYSLKKLFGHNILRILIALFSWAFFYKIYGIIDSGSFTVQALVAAIKDTLMFRHEFHLYYLHIILLVYVMLPITRIITANATKTQLIYILIIWFVLGIFYPTARNFWPFTQLRGIPLQYGINMTYSAVGYGVAGYFIKKHVKIKTQVYFGVAALGFLIVFASTVICSVKNGSLYALFLEGMSPGVCLMALGLFGGFSGIKYSQKVSAAAEKISKASFCVYLVHVLFIYLLNPILNVSILPCLVSIPIVVTVNFACSFFVYLVLSRIPFVKRYLI